MHEDPGEPAGLPAAATSLSPARRPTRAQWSVIAGLLALVLIGGAVLIAQRSADEPARNSTTPSGATSSSPSSTAERNGPAQRAARDSAIKQILNRRAAAILQRDATAWLADVDITNSAFVASQEQMFQNLSNITFSSWAYELRESPSASQGESEKYGGSTYLPQIILRYAIKGFDSKPIAAAIGWTFVFRGDNWKIGGDDDLDATLPSGHAAPWDEREILVREGKYVLLLVDAADEHHAARFLRMADDAVRQVRRVWPDGWRRRVVISLVRDQAAYDTHLTADQGRVEALQFVAIASPVYDEIPGWTVPEGTLERDNIASFRVTFNPRLFDPDSPSNPDSVEHEVTHVATARYNSGLTPRWLFEGAAEYTAQPTQIPSPPHLPEELQREYATGSVELPIDASYTGPSVAPYRIGQFACYIIATRFGESTLRKLYQRLAPIPDGTNVRKEQDKAFREILGMSTKRFEREVAAYIESQA